MRRNLKGNNANYDFLEEFEKFGSVITVRALTFIILSYIVKHSNLIKHSSYRLFLIINNLYVVSNQ